MIQLGITFPPISHPTLTTWAGSCRSRRNRQSKACRPAPWTPGGSQSWGRRPCPPHRPHHQAAPVHSLAEAQAPRPASSQSAPSHRPLLSPLSSRRPPAVAALARAAVSRPGRGRPRSRRHSMTILSWSSPRRGRPARAPPAWWRPTSCWRRGGGRCACGARPPRCSPSGTSWRWCRSSSS
uniref:Uncharacterized protein n=1 Tax=Triticum urartu TaxID=4572 RepID=A0A8R7P293_TRIUA